MDLGVALPSAGELATPANILRYAQEAERLGYASIWTYERVLRPIAPVAQPGGGPPQALPDFYRTVYDPLETLSYLAAVTTRITLGTSIVDALLHPPVVLARRFATLDQLSGGRVVAGLGQGWMREEFQTANVPFRRMGAGFDEVVGAIRATWGPDPVRYEGRFYRITPSEVNPKPVQSRLPILVGAMTPAGIERAARIADGLNPIAFSAEMLVGAGARFRGAARAAGRDPDTLTVVARANVSITSRPVDRDRQFLGGSPDQIADDLAKLRGNGVDHVFLANMTATDIDEEIDLLGRIRTATAGLDVGVD
ncbi:TIGR03619 family F420-dependent LLM class oxidoreductase [Micromonospora sp. NPDC050397]|uniref:TIGR03619 family F420-dependent LLM class oxidoreductase n=1 Tax=Micromonospora sp. NPDC050397 TaxID=3364279 RepID=UPI00384B8A16